MKILTRSAVSAAAFLCAGSALFAQAPGQPARPAARPAPPPAVAAPAAGTAIAVIDLNQVFEQHVRFKATMEQIKNDIKNYEAAVIERRKQGTALSEKLREYQPGSPDYKKLEEELAKLSAELQVDMAIKKKDFMDREARAYYQAYQEVLEHVTAFAHKHGIGLVLRFNDEPIDPQERASVLQGVNRSVVYQRDLNITGAIVQELNRGAVAPAAVGARPAAPQRR